MKPSTPFSSPSETRDSISDIWGERTPYFGAWPSRVDARQEAEPDKWVQSACVLCSNGCALDIGVKDGKIVGVRGREGDRINKGRLGPKGLHGWAANNSSDRLTTPLIRKNGQLEPASWEEAMELLVSKSREVREKFTGDAIGIYSTGQLFIEEYYTLGLIGHAGIGTSQMDGNTRLCTATSAEALSETFGCDGQPGNYTDIDVTDCILHVGHNPAHTQTVLWARILDRKAGPKPPKIIAIDPRATATAKEADVHLAPRSGTNVAVLNGLLHLIIEAGHIDREFIANHTVGFEKLAAKVKPYTPEKVEEISGVSASKLSQAAQILGEAKTLLSTALQGIYQSNQATAAACQINNLNLIRGKIGHPGSGILQMNGQPSAQNTRECGCDGEFPAFRNWQNPEHIHDLARVWNVDPKVFPHWSTNAHAMEIFGNAEKGSVKLLWIICTNPAVSMPESHRMRQILADEKLFVVVQDAFLTETAQLADLVLPAAIWGEKTGTFTNADRTVHLARQAVAPPDGARSDFEIFLDYARRMEFQDKDGAPLVKWTTPEEAFEGWKACSKGWACDYSGLSYEKLSGPSGIQWPCNEQHPDGCERLYADLVFRTSAERCDGYGHDIETGAARTPEEYKANDPKGRAILKAADYHPPLEVPDERYPFRLGTGRLAYHFHTRTKTGRSPALQAAAPEVFVQVNAEDAQRLGIQEGDCLDITSRRGHVQAPARIGDIEPGHVFIPFHYGTFDAPDEEFHRAANELTLTGWDPVSKQPFFKAGAVQISKAVGVTPTEKLGAVAAKTVGAAKGLAEKVLGAAHHPVSHVPDYIGLLQSANEQFALACQNVARSHGSEWEIVSGLPKLAEFSRQGDEKLQVFGEKYGCNPAKEGEKLRQTLFPETRSGDFGVLRDLHGLFILASEIHVCLSIVMQAAKGLRDEEFVEACIEMDESNKRQLAWLNTQMQHRAPHTLTVPS